MHHRLAGMQLRQVTDQNVRVNGTTGILTATADALAQQIAFANQGTVALGIDKTALAGTNHQRETIVDGFIKTVHRLRTQFNPGQQLLQALAAAFTLYREDHGAAESLNKLPQMVERCFRLRLNGEVWQRGIAEIGVGGFSGQHLIGHLDTRPGFQFTHQRIGTQPQGNRLQQRTHRVHATVLIARLSILPEAGGAAFKVATVHNQGVVRQIAEQAG